VHNRGLTNERFFARTGRLAGETVGQPIRVRPSDLIRMNSFFDGLVKTIDSTAAAKFKLPLISETVPRSSDDHKEG
jgi:hypothetical protein